MVPILQYPWPGEEFTVDTDVSNVGIGVLSQVQEGKENACSSLLTTAGPFPRMTGTTVTQQELLERMLEHFHKCPYGQQLQSVMTTPP
jgi:hypothetical protein